MRFGRPVRIALAAGLLVLALVGFVVREGVAVARGREVVLPMQGYDPRSLLSGHYVAFQLGERLDGQPCPPGAGDGGREQGWVALSPKDGRHAVAGLAPDRAAALALGEVAVRGTVWCPPPRSDEMRLLSLELGLDRFHADQPTAEALEAALRTAPTSLPQAFAVVSVGADGKARLKGVIVGGERRDLTWF